MNSPAEILTVWKRFDSFPMETLTKAWFLKNTKNPRQRSVPEMETHRKRLGASGNCFDLALWLKEEFTRAGIESYYVGDHLGTKDAHVAVIALTKVGERFLCDLGDLWIQPISIENNLERAAGFFTGAEISIDRHGTSLNVQYLRPNGKASRQHYDLTPVSDTDFMSAADFSQKTLSRPLVEMRVFEPHETIHWEFDEDHSFYSTMAGLKKENPLATRQEQAVRISEVTKMKADYVLECLTAIDEFTAAISGG